MMLLDQISQSNYLKNLIKSLKNNKAVIPFINSKDSIKYKVKNQLFNLK